MTRTEKQMEMATFSNKSLPSVKFERALIVDDNKINLIVGKKILNELFENVDIASSGSKAIEFILEGTTYDFVFMDLNMPDMNGIEATKKLLDFDPTIKVFAQTADVTEATKENILANRFIGIINKPYTVVDVNEAIQSL
jgi:CheY-like chemotaxis protein